MSQNNNTTKTLPKAYEPNESENSTYNAWETNNCFHADENSDKKKYAIVIPPPNVTGMLTMGHVLNNTLQDILIRYHRMQGLEAVWIPGTDHAGIATQNVVEKALAKEKISRHDLGREKFVEKVWEWKEKYGGIILKQLRKLGCSCDWTRERFTMDEGLSDAVQKSFIKLYQDGLIYKGKYIINWCPRCRTALSDEEKIPEDTNGSLWYMRYPLKDKKGYIVIATTRPETMLGDTAVAVNPTDERYKDLIGQKLILPFTGREIPILADDYVDKSFGTGAVKITPAHDPNDFELGRRHNLEQLIIMDETGVMNENAFEFAGMDRFEAREAIVKRLEEENLLEKIEPHSLAVGHCERCKTVIEPYLSDQWFVKMKPLAEKAIKAYKDGTLRFTPNRWGNVYLHWMENIRDWCISRQLWWGHRIPAYTCQDCKEIVVSEKAPSRCPKCSSHNIIQDSDVLDTWFSSWLWPFSIMGWPENTQTLKKFYPTDTLVTGPDIIFFWVARMVMAGYHFVGECPFSDVYFTSIVRDMKGRKMSKSLGNSPDPLDIIEKYGADALRYTVVSLAPVGQDIRFSENKVEIGRNFANKLWNASRFVLMNLTDSDASIKTPLPQLEKLNSVDRWILSRMSYAVDQVKTNLSAGSFKFNDALKNVYEFIWNDFCDWYIEMSKSVLFGSDLERKSEVQQVLTTCLDTALRLLHPFMPFVTEEIWQKLPGSEGFLMEQPFPEHNAKFVNVPLEEEISDLMSAVRVIRNMRVSANISPAKKLNIKVVQHQSLSNVFAIHENLIKALAGVENLETVNTKPSGHLIGLMDSTEICLDLAGIIDIQTELLRIEKEIDNTEKNMAKISGKLENESFVSRAPSEVVEKIRTDVEGYKEQLAKLQEYQKELRSL
ncbi:MAG: valine--tRNA ligase [Candidatus Ozemobacteraceae bacterium]|nr:valine--tRNA ligase [Candidatus Riflebacteria bacterium]MDD2623896.1 valine--tRNA ligase [Candidatus Riflebacteria bacterium]